MIMDLEDIKTKWKSVKQHIDPQLDEEILRHSMSKGVDAKSRLLRRSLWSQVIVSICLLLMSTSRIWAPLKLPYWWLAVFGVAIFSGFLCSVYGYRKIKKINLWEDSNAEIMDVVISLKKLYRNMELVTFIVVMPLLLWISFIPSFIYTWRMYYVWALAIIAFVLEYFWYRDNMKQFNNIINWK